MRYLDCAFAWAILLNAVSFMLAIEILHLRGAILDVPFLWLLVAMLNFLRLRNGYARVPGLMATCVGANFVALTLEIVRGSFSETESGRPGVPTLSSQRWLF